MMDQLFPSVDDEMETVALDGGTIHPLQESSSVDSSLEAQKASFGSKRLTNSFSHSNSSKSYRSPSGRPDLLIEPPSYADVVFTPYNGKQRNRSLESAQEPQKNYLRITVSDPQKVQENTTSSVLAAGGGTYVTYLITTATNIPEFEGTSFSVRRRFREVVALADKLAEVYKGYFIPPRPDKNLAVMQRQDFIDQRREALEKYFTRLAEHPVLRKSSDLRVFLKAPGGHPFQMSPEVQPSAMVDVADKPQVVGNGNGNSAEPIVPAKGSRDFLRALKELKQYVANDWGGTKPLVVEEDKRFLERKEKMQDFERELVQASEQAEFLVKAQEDIGTVMGDLGLALSRFGQFESEEPAIVVGNAAVKASRCYREANIQCMKHLDTFHEYLALMQAVHGAFGERSKALLTVQTLKSDIASMQARYEKVTAASLRVFGGDRRKVEELKTAMTNTEAACAAAQAEYNVIKERNWEEIERYESKRETDLFEMLKGFVHTQVGYAEKLGKAWSEVAESTRVGESSAIGSSM